MATATRSRQLRLPERSAARGFPRRRNAPPGGGARRHSRGWSWFSGRRGLRLRVVSETLLRRQPLLGGDAMRGLFGHRSAQDRFMVERRRANVEPPDILASILALQPAPDEVKSGQPPENRQGCIFEDAAH